MAFCAHTHIQPKTKALCIVLEADLGCVDWTIEKQTCHFGEFVGILGGKIAGVATASATLVHFGVAIEIITQAVGDNFPLGDNLCSIGGELPDFVK